MRLFEFAEEGKKVDNTEAASIVASVLGYLQARADEKDLNTPYGLDSILQMAQNAGANIDRQNLIDIAKNHPAVKNLVRSISDDKLILSTEDGKDTDQIEKPSEMPPEQRVDMMAQRARSRRQQ